MSNQLEQFKDTAKTTPYERGMVTQLSHEGEITIVTVIDKNCIKSTFAAMAKDCGNIQAGNFVRFLDTEQLYSIHDEDDFCPCITDLIKLEGKLIPVAF